MRDRRSDLLALLLAQVLFDVLNYRSGAGFETFWVALDALLLWSIWRRNRISWFVYTSILMIQLVLLVMAMLGGVGTGRPVWVISLMAVITLVQLILLMGVPIRGPEIADRRPAS